MNEEERLEGRIKKLATNFKYPRTPNLASDLGKRDARPGRFDWRLALPIAAVIVAAGVVVAVPPVRAALVEVFGLGSVEIVLGEPTPIVERVEISLPGETTLESAREVSVVPILLPPGLGSPDQVFVLSRVGNTVVLAWEDEGIALYVIPPGPLVQKLSPENVEQTLVNGRPAIWTSGDHFLELVENDPDQLVFVTEHVLVWTEDDVTYRLETNLPLIDAILIAESVE